jgi:hypothetical protein
MPRFLRDGASGFAIEVGLIDRYDRDGNSMDDHHWAVSATIDALPVGVQRYPDPRAAYRAYHQTIRDRQAEGYALVVDGLPLQESPPATFSPQPHLEAVLDASLSDDAAWLRLATAWSDAGDPRGACVLASLESKTIVDPALFLQRKKQAEAARRSRNWHLLGPLEGDAYRVETTFQRGLLDGVRIATETETGGRTTAELLTSVLMNPTARFVTKLAVEAGHLPDLVAALGAAGLPTLTTLRILTPWSSQLMGDLLEWIADHPRLEEVELSTRWWDSPDDAAEEVAVAAEWMTHRERWPSSLRRFVFRGKVQLR